MKLSFDNSYRRLPDRFYTRLDPEPVAEPRTIRVNEALAERLGFDPAWLATPEGAKFAVGNTLLDGSEPIATVYAGHQFGGFSAQLGDGRAILLGEVLDPDGQRFDIQLKGSGRTPYSRRGDGRSPLGPVLREYIISEAMAALGIPTTRALVAASTGEQVYRETAQPGGVLVRVAQSHIRVGTFEYFAARDDVEGVRALFEHVVERHYPHLDPKSPVELLRAVSERQAELVAQWMLVGFIHGVMNTDNVLLSGETIDYGPCAFMNEYDPATVFSSIDHHGRYAYGNQPPIAQWNLGRLASSLLVLDDDDGTADQIQAVLDDFRGTFRDAFGRGMARKLALATFVEADWPLVEDLLELMYEAQLDYTLTFLRLTELVDPTHPNVSGFELPGSFEPWLARWRARNAGEASIAERTALMRAANPVLIPRNHLVEAALADAVEHDDFDAFHALVDAVRSPQSVPAGAPNMLLPPRPEERVHATFCGT